MPQLDGERDGWSENEREPVKTLVVDTKGLDEVDELACADNDALGVVDALGRADSDGDALSLHTSDAVGWSV